MTIVQLIYNFLVSGLALVAMPLVWCHASNDPQRRAALRERLGYEPSRPDSAMRRTPTIWIHAVSVGEVKAAETIITALDSFSQNNAIVLTTTTMTGQAYARRQLGNRATVRYAPVDLWWSTARFVATHQPDILACMETEIWPNWIAKAHASGIRTAFLNGRISIRSIRSYHRIRSLMRPILEKVDAFSMISETDAERIVSLGAPAQRVRVNGNVKMDASGFEMDDAAIDDLRYRYALTHRPPVFIAGSIRGMELPVLLDVYIRLAEQVPDLVFIAAPRHIENAARLGKLADDRGIDWQFRTELEKTGGIRQAPVIILDTIGELRSVYSMATVVFCGGSLAPLGGQNVLEAAVWAKPVLFGPSMEDFQEARTLLEDCGGGICVKDGDELAARAGYLLTHPEEARHRGRQARRVVQANQGAARRHAQLIADLMMKRSSAYLS